MADLQAELQIGLGDRYVLERELGRGGMATVYLARDLKHGRPVALKVLHPQLAATLGPTRFRREIETAARLQHPHILTVLDSGEAAGQLWFTMPFVEGESLRDRLRRERQLPIEDAIQIAREAAQALQYAHQHGVIHRDIKPENLLLTSDGNTLVADFGIARGLADEEERLTSTGLVVGTPAYMSPEQASGEKTLDARTDIYALGCVLYEMLAGEPPYTGPTAQVILARRLTDPVPSVRHARPAVPESVEQVVTRALAQVPADRFSSAAEFSRGLQLTTGSTAIPTARSPAADGRARARMPVTAMALGLGILIGLGVLFAWRRSRTPLGDAADARALAVLPFENLGDSADGYFAEGVTNDVRSKISQIRGLVVIARASSNQYKNTRKPQQEIANELGVEYLLTATVQWEKAKAGSSRVHVTPELVEIHPGRAPRSRWGASFDAAMTDVFQVQADIAEKVAQALDLALADSTKRELAAKPTRSLAAYDAFLRGEAASQGMSAYELPGTLRRAVAAYEQAVALDTNFVQAWAQLARAQAELYYSGTPDPSVGEAAKQAVERLHALAPDRAESHQAAAAYYRNVPRDPARAYLEDSTALVLAPGNAEVLAALGLDEFSIGRLEPAKVHLQQAVHLDPRSARVAQGLGDLLLSIREYPEAERALQRALDLAPTDLSVRNEMATLALAEGDLSRAREIVKGAPSEVDSTDLVAEMAMYQDLGWILQGSHETLLFRLRPSAYDGDRGGWGVTLAENYAIRGNQLKAKAYADSALPEVEKQVKAAPNDALRHTLLGRAFAILGNKSAAVREGQRGVALLPIAKDVFLGPYLQHQLVRIYLEVGEPEKALDNLEPLLKVPYYLSSAWLKIDPMFDPLRKNPRFQRLVATP